MSKVRIILERDEKFRWTVHVEPGATTEPAAVGSVDTDMGGLCLVVSLGSAYGLVRQAIRGGKL